MDIVPIIIVIGVDGNGSQYHTCLQKRPECTLSNKNNCCNQDFFHWIMRGSCSCNINSVNKESFSWSFSFKSKRSWDFAGSSWKTAVRWINDQASVCVHSGTLSFKEEWNMENVCWWQGCQQSHKKYRFLMLRIEEMLVRACLFTNLDFCSRYHQIQIRAIDEWKLAFKKRHGLYECLVMPSSLKNAPDNFMQLMIIEFFLTIPDDLHGCLFDVILLYIKNVVDYVCHQVSFEGCQSESAEIKCSQVWILVKWVEISRFYHRERWVEDGSLEDQNTLTSTVVIAVRSFMGLALDYQRFICNFRVLITPVLIVRGEESLTGWIGGTEFSPI